jgi:hypothetical protein
MIPVWSLAIIFLLFGCSLTPINQSTFVAAPPPLRHEAQTEPPKAESKRDAATVQPNNSDIQSAIHASDEARELLDRRRYILDAGSDKDNVR